MSVVFEMIRKETEGSRKSQDEEEDGDDDDEEEDDDYEDEGEQIETHWERTEDEEEFAKEDDVRYGSAFEVLRDELLGAHNWEQRREILYFIRESAKKLDPRVIGVLRKIAKRDPNVNVRSIAGEILVHQSLNTVPEQIWLLGHDRAHTRVNAIGTLEQTAEATDDAVLVAFSFCLLDRSSSVRARATQAITLFAKRRTEMVNVPPVPEVVMERLLLRLEDMDSKVRHFAAEGVVEVATEKDVHLVPILAGHMVSQSNAVRRAAADAMAKLAFKFGEVLDPSKRPANPLHSPLAQIKRLILHQDPAVSRVAMTAMEGVSTPHCSLFSASSKVTLRNQSDVPERKMGELLPPPTNPGMNPTTRGKDARTPTGIAYSEFSAGGERPHDSLDLDDDEDGGEGRPDSAERSQGEGSDETSFRRMDEDGAPPSHLATFRV